MLVNHGHMQIYWYPVAAAPQYAYEYRDPNQHQVFAQPYMIPVAVVHPTTPHMTQYPATPRNTTDFIPNRYQMSSPSDAPADYWDIPSGPNSPTRPCFERNADLYNIKADELVNGVVRMDSDRTYQVTKFLSKGTFGKTYKVWSIDDSRYLAMKIINHSTLKKQVMNRNEVNMLQIITRNSKDVDPLLRLVEYQETEKTLMIVTELFHEDVAISQKRIAGPTCMSLVQSLAHQLLSAVVKIHSLGLVHSDLKWSNVMFVNVETDLIKVIDYGCTLTKTRLRQIHGCEQLQTPTHRAPEVILGLPLSEKMDVWSVGIMLIEIFTGRRMFQFFNKKSIIWAITQITGVPKEFAQGLYSHKHLTPDPSQAGVYMYAKPEEINENECWYKHNNFDSLYLYGTNPTKMRTIDIHFQNLISRLLAPSASVRISASEALRHPFFFNKFSEED